MERNQVIGLKKKVIPTGVLAPPPLGNPGSATVPQRKVFNKMTSRCFEFRVTPRVQFLHYSLCVAPPSVLSDRACALTLSAFFWEMWKRTNFKLF